MTARLEKLREMRRRLGPYVAIQREDPWRLNDAGIARELVRVIELLMEMETESKKDGKTVGESGLRKCSHCGGPGPCLWGARANGGFGYLCRGCHPTPNDSFFTRPR